MPGIGLGGRVFREKLEDGLVFPVGERLAEGLDIVEKDLDRSCERELFFFIEAGKFESRFFGSEFQALALLRLQRLCRSPARRGTFPPAVLSPFDDVATGADGPLDPAPRVARERNIPPATRGLYLLRDIDAGHRSVPLAKWTLLWPLSRTDLNILLKTKAMWQPDL